LVSIDKLVEKIEELPTPDFIVQKIISVASDPNASVKELADSIMMDASLSSKVLKLANSAYYGIPRKITVLNEAIMILGFKTVRNLAMSVFTYNSLFAGGGEESGIDRKSLWRHFVFTAIASEALGEILGYPVKEELFINGLLHDIGKIAIDVMSPRMMKTIHEVARGGKKNFLEVEETLDLPPHTIVGAKLVERWGLPEMIVQTVDGHHDPKKYSDSLSAEVVAIVHIADAVVNTMYPGDSLSYGKPRLSPDALNLLSLRPKMMKRYVEKLKEKFQKAGDFLEM